MQQSTLKVKDGKTISLVGGDMPIDGGSVQSRGTNQVVSVQSAGEVPVDPEDRSVAEFKRRFRNKARSNYRTARILDASGEGGGRL